MIVLVTSCSSNKPPPPSPLPPPIGNEPVQRLIRDTVQVDHAKAHVETMRKQKSTSSNSAFGARELSLIVGLADDAVQTARNTLLAGDLATFERAMEAVQQFLNEFHGRVNRAREEQKRLAAERAYDKAQKSTK
jgi:hypothetical protein